MRLSDEPLISRGQLAVRVAELAAQLSADYEGRRPILLVVLKGSIYFAADLARRMSIPVELEFIRAASYNGAVPAGPVTLSATPAETLAGRNVLIVEDILDSGRTARRLVDWVQGQKPESVRMIALLDKPDARRESISADYIGFTIPNAFVVGYGLDCDQQYRELPDIHTLTHVD